MVKKCRVYGCRTNYLSELKAVKKKKTSNNNVKSENNRNESDSNDNMDAMNDKKISVYRFPKDPCERERWRKVIPTDNLIVNDETVMCISLANGFRNCKTIWEISSNKSPVCLEGHTFKSGSYCTTTITNNKESIKQCSKP